MCFNGLEREKEYKCVCVFTHISIQHACNFTDYFISTHFFSRFKIVSRNIYIYFRINNIKSDQSTFNIFVPEWLGHYVWFTRNKMPHALITDLLGIILNMPGKNAHFAIVASLRLINIMSVILYNGYESFRFRCGWDFVLCANF